MNTVVAFTPLFAELQRRGWFPLWSALLLAVLAVLAVGVLYIKEARRLGLIPRLALATVRVTVVLLVAFLLMRPVWVWENTQERRRPVAVLIDVSQSMDSNDPRPNTADQWRVALAYGLIEPDKGLPIDTPPTTLGSRLPERPKRIEVAREALLNPKLGLLPGLASKGPVEFYTFGLHRTGQPSGSDDWLRNIVANEPRTALVAAAFELLNRDDTELPAAIVLVTDGRDNASSRGLDDLARECARRKVPVFAYGVGSSSFAQLQTAFGSAATAEPTDKSRAGADTDVPNTLFVDDAAAIPIRYTVKGVSGGVARLVLKYGDREVATRLERFSLSDEEVRSGKTFASVLRFVPNRADAESRKQEYSVTVTVTTGEGPGAETITNTISRPAQVVSRKLKLLWVDSLPRWDFQFMMRDLLRDRRIEARLYLTDGDKQAMRSGPPWMVDFSREVNGVLNLDREEFRKILFDFDLLILGAVPGKFFKREHQEVIKEFVTEGGGLIHIAGRSYAPAPGPGEPDERRAPAAWANASRDPRTQRGETNPLGELLPVEVEDVRSPIEPLDTATGFVPVIAPQASRNAITVLEDDPIDNAQLWGKLGPPPPVPPEKQLKPMYWYYPVVKAKPATDVLLVHPTARTPEPDNKPMPLLVGHHYGKGYVLFCGFDDTWRWRFNNQSKYSGRFYTQAIYTAGIPRILGTRQTQIATNTPTPVLGGTGEIFVRAFDENFRPLTADEIEGTLEKLDADPNDKDHVVPIKLQRASGSDGEYVATVAYNRVGQYRLTVDPKNKSPATLNFTVNYPENHELAPAAFDEPALRKLCENSGGKFYREEDLIRLPADVKPQTIRISTREEILLWNEWAMAVVIGLLTVEWFLRKFNSLS